MGLNNQYIGEAVSIAPDAPIGSPAWFHKFSNRKNTTALSESEALDLSKKFAQRIETVGEKPIRAEELPEDELNKLVAELIEAEPVGRILEADEVEFLAREKNFVVIDV